MALWAMSNGFKSLDGYKISFNINHVIVLGLYSSIKTNKIVNKY